MVDQTAESIDLFVVAVGGIHTDGRTEETQGASVKRALGLARRTNTFFYDA